MKKLLFGIVSAIVMALGYVIGTQTASFWIFYQPKTPKSLRKE